MASKRRQLAALLDRAGLSRALLMARKRGLSPWDWLTVLTYHRVGETVAPGFDPDVLDATPAVFERQVKTLQRYFNLIDTRDLDVWRAGGKLPANPAMITFDDGYRDNHQNVMPILRRLGAKAVFFVATSYITERRVFWWELVNHALFASTKSEVRIRYPQELTLALTTEDVRKASIKTLLKLLKQQEGVDMERFLEELYRAADVPFSREREREIANEMLMTWDQIRGLKDAGFDVQSHSHAHRVLHTLSADEAREDLAIARRQLEDALDAPVSSVAYPTGRPIGDSASLRQAVLDAGYRYGFTVEKLTPIDRLNDWLGIPRIMMDHDVSESFFRTTLAVPALAY
jgi:peptidoglycan/xylan/chitin deacetylase (PgdA/CDA1 family)